MEPYKHHSPIELKVKALTLASEARIIKRLEQKLKKKKILSSAWTSYTNDKGETFRFQLTNHGPSPLNNPRRAEQFFSLQDHRLNIVRLEARATHLARGFLRGTPYSTIEQKCWPLAAQVAMDLWKKVEKMVRDYGEGDLRDRMQKFEEWVQAGSAYRIAYLEAQQSFNSSIQSFTKEDFIDETR